MINSYALELCKKTPSHIGRLVGAFRIDFGETGSPFNLTDLRRVYDSRALAVLARAAGKTRGPQLTSSVLLSNFSQRKRTPNKEMPRPTRLPTNFSGPWGQTERNIHKSQRAPLGLLPMTCSVTMPKEIESSPPLHRIEMGCPMLLDVRSIGTTDDRIGNLSYSHFDFRGSLNGIWPCRFSA